MGGCQNYGPFLGTLNIRGRIMKGTQKGTIILTTTHMDGCIGMYKLISGKMRMDKPRGLSDFSLLVDSSRNASP